MNHSSRRFTLVKAISSFAVLVGALSIYQATGKASNQQSRSYVLIWKNNSDAIGGSTWSTSAMGSCKTDLTQLTNLLEEPCSDLGARVRFLINSLSPCEIDNEVSCVSRVETSEDGQSWLPAQYLSEIRSPTYDWKSSPSRDLSKASVGSVYLTAARSLLALKAIYQYPRNLEPVMSVQALSVVKEQVDSWDDYTNKNCLQDSLTYGNLRVSECLVQIPTRHNIRVVLDLRWQPGGWIHSQIENAGVRISQLRDRWLVTVEGSSVQIPNYRATFKSDVAEDVRVWCTLRQTVRGLDNDPLGFCGGAVAPWVSGEGGRPPTPSISLDLDALGGKSNMNPVATFNDLVQLRPEASQAVSENMTWRFLIKPQEFEDYELGKCSNTGFVGSVSGNPMAIESTIPVWNTKDSTLNFVVASPHLTSEGEVASGFYELQIRENSAKCLWGVSITPQNVQISVVDQNGVPKVAIAAVSVRNGMVRFRATGFTYSTARFKIGLKATKRAKLAERVRCAKKGVTKLQPKGATSCPKGWRRK